MNIYTYTIRLRGRYYALAMTEDGCTVRSVDMFDASGLPLYVPCVRTMADRNAAIMACAAPRLSWRSAYDAACAAGTYAGTLFSGDDLYYWVMYTEHFQYKGRDAFHNAVEPHTDPVAAMRAYLRAVWSGSRDVCLIAKDAGRDVWKWEQAAAPVPDVPGLPF